MLEVLNDIIKNKLIGFIQDKDGWDSLVINRRKPYTYRAFYQYGEYRVCLHRFEQCDPQEAFPHPHAWPAAFRILEGEYMMNIWEAPTLMVPPIGRPTVKLHLTTGSSYEMVNPKAWHTIQPLKECYTVMVNGAPYPAHEQHANIVTTKGKDLDKMSPNQLQTHFETFLLHLI